MTSSRPSKSAYDRATGYGCPDTAPCDAQFFGLSNQLYKAARQFKIYQAFPASFNHRAGRFNAVRLHPNAACGAPQVYIENQATAGLYNYTPYQPNSAALANLYGTGDSCSAYGNRNFWRIFSDWFGSPNGGSLVRTTANPSIFLVTDTMRHPVTSAGTFSSLGALGPHRVVSQAFLDSLALGRGATNLLRDPRTGEIYLAAYGSKNLFTSCAMVQTWGFGASCGQYMDVTPAQQAKFVSGSVMTQFGRSAQTGTIYYITNGTKRILRTYQQLLDIAGDGPKAYTNMPQATLNMLPSGADVVSAGWIVKAPSSPNLYLADGNSRLIQIPGGTVYSDFGFGRHVAVSEGTVGGIPVASSSLGVAVECGGDSFIAGGGSLWPVLSTAGLPTTTLDAATCAALKVSPQAVTGAVFLRQASGMIYHVADGRKQAMRTMDEVRALNGAFPLVYIPATTSTLNLIPTRAPAQAPTPSPAPSPSTPLPVATLVKSASNPMMYLIDGATSKVPITSFAIAAELGVTGYSTVSDSALSRYSTASSSLNIAVMCGDASYIAGGGSLWTVPNTAGLPTTTLDPATCAALEVSPQAVTGAVFLRQASGMIYLIVDGRKQAMRTMDEVRSLNGAFPLIYIPATASMLNLIPTQP